MAISKSNIILHSLSGMVGKELVFRTVRGKTVVSARPDFTNTTWSPKQEEHRKRFREAAKEAKRMAADPAIRKKYQKKLKPGFTVYNIILKELMAR